MERWVKDLMTLKPAWAPPRSDPRLLAVVAPDPGEMSHEDYQWLLRDRLQAMIYKEIQEEGEESARAEIRAMFPFHHRDILEKGPETWPRKILEAGELVETRLNETLWAVNWPVVMPAKGKPAVLKAVRETGLAAWLCLAVPREID